MAMDGVRLTWRLVLRQRKAFLPLVLLWTFLLYHMGSFSSWTLRGMFFGVFLLLIALLDGRYGYIFDRLLCPMAAVGLGFGAILSPRSWMGLLLSISLGSGILFLLRWLSGGGIGAGDVKFMAALGCWFPWEDILLTLLFAFWAGGITALWLLGTRKKTVKDTLPFGPFLAGSALLVFLFGEAIMAWYRSFL